MSNLTKVFIVLLSVVSIFMCGAVTMFVASSQNYRKMADDRLAMVNSLKSDLARQANLLSEKTAEWKAMETDLKNDIQQMTLANEELKVAGRAAQRQKLAYEQEAQSWRGLVTNFEQTIAKMEDSRNLTQEQLDKLRSEMIEDRRELNEITASLYEKVVQMQALEADRRRFREQIVELEKRLAQDYDPQQAAVTPQVDRAQPAVMTMADEGGLRGLITEVGASLVTISIGAADGVEEGMEFHVTRGDEFLCDVVITDVDTNRSAGVLELVQQRPQVGDLVSTNL